MVRALGFLASLILLPILSGSQINGSPVAFAGVNFNDAAAFAEGRPALLAHFGLVQSLAMASDGSLVTGANGFIRKIGADGLAHTLASGNTISNSVNVATDRQGNVYYTTLPGIYQLTVSGAARQIAGGGKSLPQDGLPATSAIIYAVGLAVDPAGTVIFSEGVTRQVWRIDNSGILRLVAGSGIQGEAGEGGPAQSAQLVLPARLAYDSAGNLFIQDESRIVKVTPDGTLLRVSPANTPLKVSAFAVDGSGNVYFSASGSFQVSKLSAAGGIVVIAGTGNSGVFSNGCGSAANPTVGDAKTAQLGSITALAVDHSGNVLVFDWSRNAVRQITPSGQIANIAGAAPSFGGDGGPATAATFFEPHGLAFDSTGNLYIADTGNNRIRKIDSNGIINTIAGQGGPTGDMTYACSGASDTSLAAPEALAIDSAGNIYIADTGKNRILKLTPDGALSVFASSIPLNAPRAIGVDRNGNVWIGDNAFRTLKIGPDGKVLNVLPRLRARSFSSDAQGNLYLTAGMVAYQVMEDDQLLPLAGLGLGPNLPLIGGPPAIQPDVTWDNSSGSGLTRDAQGTLYNVRPGGVDLITQGCNVTQLPDTPGFFNAAGLWSAAEAPQGDVYTSDRVAGVIWRLPHLIPGAGELPTPRFASGAAVQNAASTVIHSFDMSVPTGGFSSTTERFVNSDSVAPGEIVRIYGQCLGPLDTTFAAFDSDGRLPTRLAGVGVSFGGTPAPLVSVQAGFVTAITPFSLNSSAQNLTMSLTYNGAAQSYTLNTVPYRPGLFSYFNADGTFTVLALNPDGTLNSAAHPATVGSVVALYATGLGATEPPAADGQAATDITARYQVPVQVTVNGVAAPVQYAGPAPGFAGLSQINVQVPQTSSGPVQIHMGNAPFPQEVQIWVQ
jgi:uncharacterized protein (TIGR03437 family)